jgi:hypothetical protein
LGRVNIENLARYERTIEVVPNLTFRAKLNRLALEMVGDISWPEHSAIFSRPFKVAQQLGIKLMFYGECPQEAYGGPVGSDEAKQMTRRCITEFGGFLGLRPKDFVGLEGITARDMEDYQPPAEVDCEAYFLGQFYPWDSHRNAKVALDHGMVQSLPSAANWWPAENLDNAQTGLHDRLMFLKYGFGRGCQQISVDVRMGMIDRAQALAWVERYDGLFPTLYAEVHIQDVLNRIGMTPDQLRACEDRFRA